MDRFLGFSGDCHSGSVLGASVPLGGILLFAKAPEAEAIQLSGEIAQSR
jgi:hypothetical protein